MNTPHRKERKVMKDGGKEQLEEIGIRIRIEETERKKCVESWKRIKSTESINSNPN